MSTHANPDRCTSSSRAAPAPRPARSAAPAAGGDERLRLYDMTAFKLRMIDLERDAVGDRATIVAEVDGSICGNASYVRVYGPRAVLLIDVDDAFWQHGLPGALLTALCARATRLGIATFLVRVCAADIRLLALLREEFGAHGRRDGAYVELQFSAERWR
jgi:GNAT superfamily N-acetyltransferase